MSGERDSMMLGEYMGTADAEYSHGHFKRFKLLRYGIYVTGAILLVGSLAMICVCVYMLVDWSFLDDIMDYDIPVAAMWILIIAGSFTILFIPITGLYGAYMESKKALLIHIGFLGGTFLVLITGAICAFLWQGVIGSWVSIKMEKSLKEFYGVELDDNFNRFITQQWDKAQIQMQCCGVYDEGWVIYRQSRWYYEQPYIKDQMNEVFPGTYKHLVPESCCVLTSDNRIADPHKCQRFMEGPPFRPEFKTGSKYNKAVHYPGCYSTARKWLTVFSSTLIGLGLTFAILMMINFCFSLAFLLMIR